MLLAKPTHRKKYKGKAGQSYLRPMIVDTVHQLAAASKQAEGITFTNKDGTL